MNKAVLLIIFNREEKAKEVLDAIRKVKPNRLYIAADGPRKNIKEDYEKCKKTREIINYIDWDCQINTLFRDTNLGSNILYHLQLVGCLKKKKMV